MKKGILLAALAALMITPAAAMANTGSSHGKGAPKVMYVLRGTLSNYTAYDATTQTAGSITIDIKSANYHGKALKNMSLTFAVGANTKISLENGVSTVSNGDTGIVKIKAAKKILAIDLATTLQATVARQVVDQGASS